MPIDRNPLQLRVLINFRTTEFRSIFQLENQTEIKWETHAASNRQQAVLQVMNENKSKEVSKLVKGVGNVQHFQRTCSFASYRGARSGCGIRLYAFCKRLRILVHGRSLHYAGWTSPSGKMIDCP
jgi:hypothetical protein